MTMPRGRQKATARSKPSLCSQESAIVDRRIGSSRVQKASKLTAVGMVRPIGTGHRDTEQEATDRMLAIAGTLEIECPQPVRQALGFHLGMNPRASPAGW
jgi:hypothetical protein